MLDLSEVLPGIRRLDPVPGNAGRLSVEECFPQITYVVAQRIPLTLFRRVTGCGKSNRLPEKFAEFLSDLPGRRRKLLVLTTAAKDVADMHGHVKNLRSRFRYGGRVQGGCDWRSADIVLSTIGLACRWYETNGIEYFDAYNAVILDEIGSVERNVEYSFLFELMLAVQRRHEEWPEPFLILMCAATVSDRLDGALGMLDPLRIQLPKRPYELERYEVDVGSLQELWQAMATAAAHLLRKGKTSLVVYWD